APGRCTGDTAVMEVPPGDGVLRFGEVALDLATGELHRADEPAPVVLGARPARLLALLAWRHGQLVTRDEIQAYIWSDGTTVDFDQSINQHIRQLRQTLGDSAAHPAWIQTLPARGYRFLVAGALDPVAAPAPSEERSDRPGEAIDIGATVDTGHPGDASARRRTARKHRRIGAATLIGIAFAALLLATSDSGSVTDAPTAEPGAAVRLAVLPLDSDPDDRPRAITATEELIAALGEAYAPDLEVIALRSVMRYRGTTSPPSTIARELGVDFVLEGRVRTQLDRTRITLGLVRGRDSAHVWMRTFEQSQHSWTTEAVMAQDV